jgi:GNAT superfamily N-acetyltransferase
MQSGTLNITYKKYKPNEISKETWRYLKRLTLKQDSGMRYDYIPYMQRTNIGVVIIAFNYNQIVGWACHASQPFLEHNCAFYVMRRFRKNGIGKGLFDNLKNESVYELIPQLAKKNYNFFSKVVPSNMKCACETNQGFSYNHPLNINQRDLEF